MKWSLISAVNNEEVLNSCLLRSPAASKARETILKRGYSAASAAYNSAIQQAATDFLVFAHQDMYFPNGWGEALEFAVQEVSKRDPSWGVLGVWGTTNSGTRAGHLYCVASGKVLGQALPKVQEIDTLDEVVLIVRKSSGLRFSEGLPGFHMYGADICLQAKSHGMKSYAIDAFCIHNANSYQRLPREFWKSYMFMRSRWKAYLPIITPCTEITYSCSPMLWTIFYQAVQGALKPPRRRLRVADPALLYQELVTLNHFRTQPSLFTQSGTF